ncbi:unnamed protein product [Oppiella nova]|uniref:Beta-glucuronidase n=1 Tax=Oppiella nova TaxID=334625 RepID=A0A7R9LQY7_9ACAR|nr:unnamed protein product [Oppiella nova]CAG2166055.1 unnamed protein product [Oppiella nova]
MNYLHIFLLTFLATDGLAEDLRLYPRESETRQVKDLDGFWSFRVIPLEDDQNIGFTNKWYSKPLDQRDDVIPMPVPSSYNDITQSRFIRDYSGWVWYDNTFFVPIDWTHKSVTLRFGSAHYQTVVYLNGVNVLNHTGGHLPFEAYVDGHLKYGENNLVTVAISNVLSESTVPQGSVTYKNDTKLYPKGFYETTTNFDFFNYAGIHRHVSLYVLPQVHITDITVTTDIKDTTTGVISYTVIRSNLSASVECIIDVLDKKGNKVADNKGFSGVITITNATFWWPYTMDPNPGYQYTLKVLLTDSGKTVDVYYQKVGIRTVRVTDKEFIINGKPFYFRGFGKHEDANIRGKGLDLPIIAKDFNLIKWMGANSFRTSHYPYSEELMDMADAEGIVVIDECPAVGLHAFNDVLLGKHLALITEMIQRDKNRPSVVMWSVANEPLSDQKEAEDYFQKVSTHARGLDNTRPLTAATKKDFNNDKMSAALDVLMINRYYGWYSDTGFPQVIEQHLTTNIIDWHNTHRKPIIVSEYGADTVPGLHQDPAYVFSEDYESELLMHYHRGFDRLRSDGLLVGEHVWNFADFMTTQKTTLGKANRKGIFTRERQPKAGARILRCRYWALAEVKSQQHSGLSYCPVD